MAYYQKKNNTLKLITLKQNKIKASSDFTD